MSWNNSLFWVNQAEFTFTQTYELKLELKFYATEWVETTLYFEWTQFSSQIYSNVSKSTHIRDCRFSSDSEGNNLCTVWIIVNFYFTYKSCNKKITIICPMSCMGDRKGTGIWFPRVNARFKRKQQTITRVSLT